MKSPEIIGLAGTNGSGKDTVGHLLSTYHKYLFISVTDILRAELKKRNVPITRENLRALSAEWRKSRGLGVLVDLAAELYKAAQQNYAGVVIASLRNPGEADKVHELGGTVIWVDAEPKVRYERVQANAASRGRNEEDNKSYDQFLKEEANEMKRQAGGDSTTLDMGAVKEKSDAHIDNTRQDITYLRESIERVLALK
jgi:dephospho-CoA kinase